MDTQVINIFQDQNVEENALTAPTPTIDIQDWRLTPAQVTALSGDSRFQVTTQVTEQGYDEIEFHQANNYWGINFNFGNDLNGVQIRQGIAHLIDKALFAQTESDIAGSVAIDSPVPITSNFGGITFTAPNPCNWDTLYKETGANCVLGAAGGTAYNCAFASGVTPCPTGTLGPAAPNAWQAQIGSANFCAAATHIQNALNNGVLISSKGVHQNANCVLLAPGTSTVGANWPTNVTSNAPNFFVRLDDAPRLVLGDNYSQEICALFTGAYSTGCTGFLSVTHGTITSFCGFFTSTTGISLCWWMYTAAFSAFPIDGAVYFGYTSKFVSGGAWDHPACAGNTATPSANDYEYVCNAAYDVASSNVEFAKADNLHTDTQNAFTNATHAMDIFGQNVFTIPSYNQRDQAAYLTGWQGIQNSLATSSGTIAQFSWLNAYSASPSTGPTGCPNAPATPPFFNGNCFRQGFKQPTRSLSYYIASTVWDAYVLGDVYDTLGAQNPYNLGDLMDWMTNHETDVGCITSVTLCDQSLGYTAPAGTTGNEEFFLRPTQELFWQDGHRLTAFDVAFSFASLLANGAFLGSGVSPMTCNTTNCADGVSVIGGPTEFDVHLTNRGPFTLLGLMTTPILPGHLWSTCAANWDNDVNAALLSTSKVLPFPANCLSADPSKLGFGYDPINAGIMIGSGAWKCVSTGVSTPAGTLGSGCSSTGLANPPPGGTYTLIRNGFGSPAGSDPSKEYFRSSANLALELWTGYTGDFVGDPNHFAAFAPCIGIPAPASGVCLHWQEGFGSPGGPIQIDGVQIGLMKRFPFINPVRPFDVNVNKPLGLVGFNPILYQGTTTFTPSNGNSALCPAAYDC